jgi:hypothetical protein
MGMRLHPDVLAKVEELTIPRPPRAFVAPGRWVLMITEWHPVLLNKLIKAQWAKQAKFKEHDYEVVLAEALIQGVGKVDPLSPRKRRVCIRIGGKRLGDPDNYLKSLLDALVRAELLVDDRAEWCEWERPILEFGKVFTEITIEDV